MKLKNKVALVTGGNGGIGRGIVLAFIREGAKVVVNGRNEEKIRDTLREIEKLGGQGLGIKADVSSSREVKEMFSKIIEEFGTLDILVNNASFLPTNESCTKARLDFLNIMTTGAPKRSLEVTKNISDEDWQSTIEVSLNGAFYCTREALRIMEDKGSGKIINMASIAGIGSMSAHSPHYCTVKGGIISFTRAVAHEVIGSGVYVNAIAPGLIESDEYKKVVKKIGPEMEKRMLQLVPMGRPGKVEECANIAVFLASDDSNYIVGQVINASGGFVS